MPRPLSLTEHAMESQVALRDARRSLAPMYEAAIRSGNRAVIAEARALARALHAAERIANRLTGATDSLTPLGGAPA